MLGKWVILLEHTTSDQHVLKHFKNLGLLVAYVGKNSNLFPLVDRVFQYDPITECSIFLDREIESLRDLNAIGVIGFLENTKLAEKLICKELNLLWNNEETYDVFRNKALLRKFLIKCNLPSVDFFFIPDSESLPAAPMDFPFIIKPSFGYSSGGVQLVHNDFEFKGALKTIRRLNRFVFNRESSDEMGALCEEYISGAEYSVDSITTEGKTKSIFACVRRFPSGQNFSDFIYLTPFDGIDKILAEAQTTIDELASTIGLMFGPTHAEFRWCGKRNKLVLIEIGFRIGGAGNIGRLCKETTGIELNEVAIRALLRDLDTCELFKIQKSLQKYGISMNPDIGTGGKIINIRGLEFLKGHSSIIDFHFNKGIGDYIVPYPRGVDCFGEILMVSESRDQMEKLLSELLEVFKVEYEV